MDCSCCIIGYPYFLKIFRRMSKKMRVLHLPVNIAGVSTVISRSIRKLGHKSDVCVWNSTAFDFKADYNLHFDKPLVWRLRHLLGFLFLLYALPRYDVFHFSFGHSFLPDNSYWDLALIKRLGKKIVMQYYGTDVRRMSIYSRINPYADKILINKEAEILGHLQRAAQYFDDVVVFTPELKLYVDEFFDRVEIIPIPVMLEHLKPCPPDLQRSVPLVVHAPSKRVNKGTDIILQAIDDLKKANLLFEFKLVENLPHAQALQIYQQADIIIDQLLSSTYGGVTIEGMALAKPILCSLNTEMQQRYWPDIPVINVSPGTFLDELKRLIEQPKLRHQLGLNGRAYVEQYHSSMKVAKKLISIYQNC